MNMKITGNCRDTNYTRYIKAYIQLLVCIKVVTYNKVIIFHN